MLGEVKATIILPTTADRGQVLKYAVVSVLAQTESDWELFIIGDGLHEESKAIVHELVASDSRIRYFDFPKDASRGELRRHQLITEEARGEVICYLCDRDMYFQNHVELVCERLQDVDFTHSMVIMFGEDGLEMWQHTILRCDTPEERSKAAKADIKEANCPLSIVAHRRDAYLKLPYGWRTTPDSTLTDGYMWQQFFQQPWLRAAMVFATTVIYLKRGNHPGLSTPERAEVSRRYAEKYLKENNDLEELQRQINTVLLKRIEELDRRKRNRRAKRNRHKKLFFWKKKRLA